MWADEVATISAATRSVPELLHMLTKIDAVHGTYYLFMHFWLGGFGISEFALRFPSAVAVSLTALAVWHLVGRNFGEATAWWALLLTLFLPRMAWAATEGRSYAFTALIAVLLSLCLDLALRAKEARAVRFWWILYTVWLVIGICTFVYLALFAFAQFVWLGLVHRQQVRYWLVSCAVSIGTSGYLLFWILLEKGQVAWLPKVGLQTVSEVLKGQWFLASTWLSLIFISSLAWFAFFSIRTRFKSARANENQNLTVGTGSLFDLHASILGQYLVGISLPTFIILAFSVFTGSSIYDARYFTFATPFVAILLAVILTKYTARWIGLAVLAMSLAFCIQPFLELRTPEAKLTNWRVVSEAVASISHPGDAILFGDYKAQSPSLSRIPIAYPRPFLGLDDVTLKRNYGRVWGLYDQRATVDQVWPKVSKNSRVILVTTDHYRADAKTLENRLSATGFHLVKRIPLREDRVELFQK